MRRLGKIPFRQAMVETLWLRLMVVGLLGVLAQGVRMREPMLCRPVDRWLQGALAVHAVPA